MKRQTISELHFLDNPVTVSTELPGCMVQLITQTSPCYNCNLTIPFKQMAFLVHQLHFQYEVVQQWHHADCNQNMCCVCGMNAPGFNSRQVARNSLFSIRTTPLRPLPKGSGNSSPADKAAGGESDHLTPPWVTVTNEWSFTTGHLRGLRDAWENLLYLFTSFVSLYSIHQLMSLTEENCVIYDIRYISLYTI